MRTPDGADTVEAVALKGASLVEPSTSQPAHIPLRVQCLTLSCHRIYNDIPTVEREGHQPPLSLTHSDLTILTKKKL